MLKNRIIELHAQGKSYNDIAKELNCSKGTIAYHCSNKVKENYKKYRRKNRAKQTKELKLAHGGKCKICGYMRCMGALDFHHIGKKINTVSILFSKKGKKIATEEAKKCILICSNCHRELHAGLITVA